MCVETRTLRKAEGGRGGGGGCLTLASGYNFPLFLVYPVDMPDYKFYVPDKISADHGQAGACISPSLITASWRLFN